MNEPTPPGDYVFSGFFALRTPLLPFDDLLSWGADLEAPAAGDDADRLEAALAADRARLRRRLRAVVARPEVREALFVASPELEERLHVWLDEPDGEAGQKMERTLVRYFARMAGRATPFGLFAGCSVGTLGPTTRLTLAERGRYRRHTRLDMDYVVALTEALAREPGLRASLAFRPNTSLYRANGRVRYAEVRRNGKGWTHHRVAVEASAYLDATLEQARAGARPAALAAALAEIDLEATSDEAAEYIGELIDNQVLVSELAPPVTGPEPVHGLATHLRGRRTDWGERLEQTQAALEALDAAEIGVAPQHYRDIARQLGNLPAPVELPRLFQVDLVKPAIEATLGRAVLDEIVRCVHILQRLARRPAKDVLARFREAYRTRYEGREVPLVEALDEERGVGFDTLDGKALDDSTLLDDLTFPPPAEETAAWGRRETVLLGKLGEALAQGAGEIALAARDLEELAEPRPLPLPDAFALMATVAAADEAALARGEFRVLLEGGGGPSGARLLGRFCHADRDLHRHVAEHLRAEEALRPDVVFAEIVHQPEGRLGNILARPVLRAYEIPYLGQPGVPVERQLPVTDLLVSVRGDEVVLRSARLGRRILPRLTSAHNFYRSQGIYRFLGLLQEQGVAAALGWDWGPLGAVLFLPRVVSGRLVLCRATWRLGRDELRALGRAGGAARFRAMQEWRARRRLPRWVCVADGDNELPVDLDNGLSAETFVELVKGREEATLVELAPGPDELCARGPEGRYVHELVVPFTRVPEPTPSRPTPLLRGRRAAAEETRSFPPGSEWLYAKLYTGAATADQVLGALVRPVTELALRSGAADGWFFVRYGDPDWHVRLRFHGEPARLWGEVWPALRAAAAPFLDDSRVWRLQLDTYEREVERYGGAQGIVLAEQLFEADSEAALEVVGLYPEDARGDVRWRLALYGMDRLLTDLPLDLDQRREVLWKVRASFAAEFRADVNLRRQLGDRFRRERPTLERLLAPDGGNAADVLAPGRAVLRRRSRRWAPSIAALTGAAAAGQLSQSLTELAASALHMHANRVLRSAQRPQELVLYDFLARLYQSQAARGPCPGASRPDPWGVRGHWPSAQSVHHPGRP
jgi:thiopeptide-type bacteriocin biosynthesis protein